MICLYTASNMVSPTTILCYLTLKCFIFYSYGLLGPSGCGKSTLLQCILGVLPLDSGCIDLHAKSVKNIGYMPQVNI